MAKIDKLLAAAKQHLQPTEEVLSVILGTHETKMMGSEIARSGIFVATSERIFFYGKKTFGFETESFPYSNISSLEHGKSLLGRSISFFASGNKVNLKWINDGNVDQFLSIVGDRIGKKGTTTVENPTVPDVADQIRKLAALRDEGILTEEEFTEKKKQLLG